MTRKEAILIAQAERWQRLKKFRSFIFLKMSIRHFFITEHVKLLREGKRQLAELELSHQKERNN